MAKLKLPFELEKPSSNEYVTQSSQIGHNGQPLDDVLEGLDNISKQDTQSEEDAIIYATDGGVQVGKIDANGADFANLKRGGQQVARISDLPTKDSSIGENPSTTNVPTTKAVKDYVDANRSDYPIETETTQSEDEEFVASNDTGTDTYAKVGFYGVKAKAYKKLNGDDAIPPLDTTIGDNPSNSHTPSTKAVKEYVDEHGGGVGDLPISEESTQSEDEEFSFGNNAETQTYVKVGQYGIKAKGVYDLNGNNLISADVDLFANNYTDAAYINASGTPSSYATTASAHMVRSNIIAVSEGDVITFSGGYGYKTTDGGMIWGYSDLSYNGKKKLLPCGCYENVSIIIPANVNYIMAWGDIITCPFPRLYVNRGKTCIEIRVATDGSGDFTSIVDAVSSINDASEKKEYNILIGEGTYDIIDEFFGDEPLYTTAGLIVPPFVNLIGKSCENTIIKAEFPNDVASALAEKFSTINTKGTTRIENLTIKAKNCRYALHDESSGSYIGVRHFYKNCKFIHEGNASGLWQYNHSLGMGMSDGSEYVFAQCRFLNEDENHGAAMLAHNNRNDWEKGCSLVFKSCYFENSSTGATFNYGDLYSGCNDSVSFYGCKFADQNKTNNINYQLSSSNTEGLPSTAFYGFGNVGANVYSSVVFENNIIN